MPLCILQPLFLFSTKSTSDHNCSQNECPNLALGGQHIERERPQKYLAPVWKRWVERARIQPSSSPFMADNSRGFVRGNKQAFVTRQNKSGTAWCILGRKGACPVQRWPKGHLGVRQKSSTKDSNCYKHSKAEFRNVNATSVRRRFSHFLSLLKLFLASEKVVWLQRKLQPTVHLSFKILTTAMRS